MGIAIPQVITSDRASGAQVIDGSLKFDAATSEHLKRTPGSAGNRRTWTWAAWVKRTVYGADKFIFSAGSDASNQHYLRFKSDNKVDKNDVISSLNKDMVKDIKKQSGGKCGKKFLIVRNKHLVKLAYSKNEITPSAKK